MSAPQPDPMLKHLLTEPPHATERLRWLALEYREAYRGGDVERIVQILDEAERLVDHPINACQYLKTLWLRQTRPSILGI
jgi:hypothetical protein